MVTIDNETHPFDYWLDTPYALTAIRIQIEKLSRSDMSFLEAMRLKELHQLQRSYEFQ